MKKLTFIAVLFLFLSFNSYSQGNLSVHFGPALPSGDFGDDDVYDDDSGLAGMGLNFGLKYVHPLSDNGLGLFGGIDLLFNPFSKDAKDDIEEEFFDEADITFPKYINIPISAGLHYTY